ncbi:hypothetical protein HZC34_05765 [Candidatus Saganbacteria bacterium]|nr:hypothetical protein [Candidatus Saganbacteria bacterium]
MSLYMGLALQFCGIILLIALIVLAILGVLVLLDIRFVTNRLKKEIKAAAFLISIMDFIISGIEIAKKKIGNLDIINKVKESIDIMKEGDK